MMSIPSHVRQNTYLFAALLFAGYLSTAAIASIPALTEDNQSAATDVAQLRTELQGRELRIEPASFFDSNPFSALDAVLDKPPAGIPEQVRDQVEKLRDEEREAREELRWRYGNHIAFWTDQVNRGRSLAIAQFAENLDRRGNVERRQHYSAMLSWFNRNETESSREANECVRASALAHRNALSWADLQSRQIARRLTANGVALPKSRWDVAFKECGKESKDGKDQYQLFASPPARPELGARLGPFSGIALWLLKTETLSLVLIAGLFGFGLLGAAASTIIRERGTHRAPATPLVSDLPPLIVRGITAAIVVFLAVKGGLAIFGTGSPDPNPYVLMLTCLVAAVFSEPVWAGAQNYLERLVKNWGGDTSTSHPAAGHHLKSSGN